MVYDNNQTPLDEADDQFKNLSTSEGNGALPSDIINTIVEDKNGAIWLGTENGPVVIYNPKSQKRIHQLQDTQKILLEHRKPTTPVAIIKSAYRESETIVMTDLENLLNFDEELGMTSTVIIGNSSTYTYKDLMINPRGYKSKYNLEEQTNPNLKV